MSFVWLVLTNGNIPAIVVAMICIKTMKIFQRTGFGKSKTFFGGLFQLFYLAVAPQPYDKICAHLHRLHVQKKASPPYPGLA
jgi:hypothetical protein